MHLVSIEIFRASKEIFQYIFRASQSSSCLDSSCAPVTLGFRHKRYCRNQRRGPIRKASGHTHYTSVVSYIRLHLEKIKCFIGAKNKQRKITNPLKTYVIKNNTQDIDKETEAQKKSIVWLTQGYTAIYKCWFTSH